MVRIVFVWCRWSDLNSFCSARTCPSGLCTSYLRSFWFKSPNCFLIGHPYLQSICAFWSQKSSQIWSRAFSRNKLSFTFPHAYHSYRFKSDSPQHKKQPTRDCFCVGAGDRTWTDTSVTSWDFKSHASADFATPACASQNRLRQFWCVPTLHNDICDFNTANMFLQLIFYKKAATH